MQESTGITIITDSRGRATISEPARLALGIDNRESCVSVDLRLLCTFADNTTVCDPSTTTTCTAVVTVDDQGRFTIPSDNRRELGIDGNRAILEVDITICERDVECLDISDGKICYR